MVFSSFCFTIGAVFLSAFFSFDPLVVVLFPSVCLLLLRLLCFSCAVSLVPHIDVVVLWW
eukprot:m.276928 g.276928  ORF g.276928 m.276928 type:complete len:60 (+) comp54863_c0_seq7:211-390(+)